MQSQLCGAMGGPYRGKLLKFFRICACTPSRGGKRIWESRAEAGWTDGNPPCGWASTTSQTSIWSEPTEELYTREAYDASASTAGQKKTSVQLSKHYRSRTVDIPPTAERLAPPLEAPEVSEDEKEEPKAQPDEDEEMQGEPSETEMTPGVTSSIRGEKRAGPQQNVFAKKRVMMKSPKRPATPITLSDDPVKRRLMKKTDTPCSCRWKSQICRTP